jgi:hypothetical protein
VSEVGMEDYKATAYSLGSTSLQQSYLHGFPSARDNILSKPRDCRSMHLRSKLFSAKSPVRLSFGNKSTRFTRPPTCFCQTILNQTSPYLPSVRRNENSRRCDFKHFRVRLYDSLSASPPVNFYFVLEEKKSTTRRRPHNQPCCTLLLRPRLIPRPTGN